MSRVARLLKTLQDEVKGGIEKQNELASTESLDMSSIEKASFLQGEGYSSYGNPLHSTALEDESRPELHDQRKAPAGKQTGQGTGKKIQRLRDTPVRPGRAAQQNSSVQTRRKSSRPGGIQKPLEQRAETPKFRHLQTISESRKCELKERAQSPRSSSGISASDMSPTSSQTQRRSSLSSEDLTDEDESFVLSSEKRKASHVSRPRSRSSFRQLQSGQKQKRKSSSGHTDSTSPRKKQKPRVTRNPIDLDVVLEAFQEFVTQYKETVSSNAVIKIINAFSRSFEGQLTEMITATNEFNSVKRETLRVNKTLNQKMTKLLEAKNELIKSRAEVRKLEKEHTGLKQRLTALKQGTAFLRNLKSLNKRYLQHRSTHTDEPETYGLSCLPAMLLEARSITGTENQLKNINDRLQQVLEETAHEGQCEQ